MSLSCPQPAALAALATLAALTAACSTAPRLTQEQQRERYTAYAQAPIDSFTWLGRLYSWQSLGENELVVFTTPSDAYLLSVQPPCSQLPFAQVVGVTSTAGTVHARLDSVTVQGWRCPITQIRPIDYARMRADTRAAADKAKGS